MDIQKEIYKLRKELSVDQFSKLLDILNMLNERLLTHGEVLNDHTTQIGNIRYPDKPQEELKPCPCCPNRHINIYYNQDPIKSTYYSCDSCGIRTADFATELEAKKTWNRRSNA